MWAGGKNKLIPKYQKHPGIPHNGYDTFVEPFVGGGAMMIYIYKNTKIKNFVMNDINKGIIGIYQAIKNDINNFLLKLDTLQDEYISFNKEKRKMFYYKVRNEYNTEWLWMDRTEEAATLYFLMKTGFNGLWQVNKPTGRFGTASGLLNQKEVYDKKNVMEWNELLQKVDIRCGDWKKCIDVKDRTFFFFDPPYRECFADYGKSFSDDDHLELINFCKDSSDNGHIVMYCNRDIGDDFYLNNKGKMKISYYDITYTLGRRRKNDDGSFSAKKAREVLLYNMERIGDDSKT